MFKWGVLSTAKIGREQLIPAIAASSNGVVHGIASRDLSRAQALATQCGAPHAYGDYDALLADPEIDGVYIPIHSSGHVEWTAKAAQAGKHVLCEKPIAMKASEIDDLISLRDAKGVTISEAFMVNYHPQWQKVRELLNSGAIGTLRQIDGAFSYFNKDGANMRNKPELGGGGLRDIGVYPVVTSRIATNQEPRKLRAEVAYDPEFGTDIYANVTAEFDGFTLGFYCSMQLSLRQSMVFHGSDGMIELSAPFNANIYDFARIHLFNQNHSEGQIFEFAGVNQYKLQVEEFVRATTGEGQVFPLESSRTNQRVIDACFAAGETQNWINI